MNENTRASMENAIGEIKVSQKSETPARKYEKSDSLFACFYWVLGYLFIRWFLFDTWYTNFDFTLPIYTILYVFTTVMYAKSKGKAINKESIFWICVLAMITVFFKIENFFRLITAVLVAAYFTATAGGRLYGGGTSAYIIADIHNCFFSLPVVNFFTIFPATFSIFKRKEKREKFALSPAAWGVLLAGVALWFILPLLVAADSNFLSGAKEFIEYVSGMLFGGFDFITLTVHGIFTMPVACYLYGLAYGSMSDKANSLFDKAEIDTGRRKLRISPALTLKVFMYIVCFVYLLFIALQAEYLLGAFMGRLYSGMTYAQYARTGFFELCKVAGINLSLLAISNLLIRDDEQNGIKLPMAILCVLSLLLLSTATAKMAMYISVYGLTAKRIISTVFLLWLILVFIMCIVRIYKPFNLVKAAVITGAVMFCVLFSFDIGKHSDSFNEKYGFVKEEAQQEFISDDSIYLPDKLSVTSIAIAASDGTYFHTLANTIGELGTIYNILEDAQLTDIQSIQDFPDRDKYYTITIYPDMFENNPDITIYCYEKNGIVYLEQPYNGIWITSPNLPQMFENYEI